MDTAAQEALDDIEYEINNLEAWIRNEFRAWTAHLTVSRRQGPHKLPPRTSFKNDTAVMHELQMLMEQIAAHNVRAAATRDRNVDFPCVSPADLVADDEVTLVSTELPRSLLRRIIIPSRIRLHAFSRTLHDQEARLTAAYIALLKMAHSTSESLEEGKADEFCDPWSLVRDMECLMLRLKATMARVGMRMARQCVIQEFFYRVRVEGAEGGQQADEAVDLGQSQRQSRDEEMTGERDEDEKTCDAGGNGEDGDVAMDEGCEEEHGEHESESETDAGVEWQTCITDYFMPLPKGSQGISAATDELSGKDDPKQLIK